MKGTAGDIEVVQYMEIRPYVIREVHKTERVKDGEILVQPLMAGICGSDILYFKGHKEKEKLARRLPLVLLHEGVVRDTMSGHPGIIIPLRACGSCPACKNGKENLCQNAKYLGSSANGLARTFMSYPKNLILPLEGSVSLKVGTLFEPMSVVLRMLINADINNRGQILVIGTGAMGFLSVILLHYIFRVSADNIFLIGRNDRKLELLQDICQPVNVYRKKNFVTTQANTFPVVMEAVGEKSMTHALSQSIELCRPGGDIFIFGLNHQVSNINFTKIVNKGLTLHGSSRSRIEDYVKLMSTVKANEALRSKLKSIIDPNIFFIQSGKDLMEAFHYVISGNNIGKVLVTFVKELS